MLCDNCNRSIKENKVGEITSLLECIDECTDLRDASVRFTNRDRTLIVNALRAVRVLQDEERTMVYWDRDTERLKVIIEVDFTGPKDVSLDDAESILKVLK